MVGVCGLGGFVVVCCEWEKGWMGEWGWVSGWVQDRWWGECVEGEWMKGGAGRWVGSWMG